MTFDVRFFVIEILRLLFTEHFILNTGRFIVGCSRDFLKNLLSGGCKRNVRGTESYDDLPDKTILLRQLVLSPSVS